MELQLEPHMLYQKNALGAPKNTVDHRTIMGPFAMPCWFCHQERISDAFLEEDLERTLGLGQLRNALERRNTHGSMVLWNHDAPEKDNASHADILRSTLLRKRSPVKPDTVFVWPWTGVVDPV